MTGQRTRRGETSQPCARSLRDGLQALRAKNAADDFIATLSGGELETVLDDWSMQARADQWPPHRAADGAPWFIWLVLGGRGAGKTRTHWAPTCAT